MRSPRFLFAYLLSSFAALLGSPAYAQITPDQTLGIEESIVTPNVEVRNQLADVIEGGAARGANLFHSFSDFNVLDSQRVYFANPDGIESILSRVTGNNLSNIFGTLGVDGTADLFLINPNGIVFGSDVNLDVEGSFYATTAGAVALGESVFSATMPEQSELLMVKPNTSFFNYLTTNSGDIVNRGQVVADGDITLAANNLDLQGQVAAGGDLSLLAADTVKIRDTAENPFVAFAGDDLLVQGNQQVDIVALSHPESGLFSYGDMVLRSAERIGGDAHYLSGGGFRVENLDGSGGNLFSPIDPIIRAYGDVAIEGYEGTSLHILAGGSVSIGTAIINAPDVGTVGIDFLQERVALSDGTIVEIDGGARPTFDVRAGMNQNAISEFPFSSASGRNPLTDFIINGNVTDFPSSADIFIGDVVIRSPNGLVFLTNNYDPNTALPNGDITVVSDIGAFGVGIIVGTLSGQGGSVFLDSRNNISIVNSVVETTSIGTAGNVVLNANETIFLSGDINHQRAGVYTSLASGEGAGGDIRINSNILDVRNSAKLIASTFGEGNAGSITIQAADNVVFETSEDGQLVSVVRSAVEAGAVGSGGNVDINTGSLHMLNGAQLSASTSGTGHAGNITIRARDGVAFETSEDGQLPSSALSTVEKGAVGNGGNVTIESGSLIVANGSLLSSTSFGAGNSGNITVRVRDNVVFDGVGSDIQRNSAATSAIGEGGEGMGGNVTIDATSLQVLNGARLNASSRGLGNSGDVIIRARDSVVFEASQGGLLISAAISAVDKEAEGAGGNVIIDTNSLRVSNGSQLVSSTAGRGDAGSVILRVRDSVVFEGTSENGQFPSSAFSTVEKGGKGNGGDVTIDSGSLHVANGARLSASTLGTGNAGSVILRARDSVTFGINENGQLPSSAASLVGLGAEGNGGNVIIESNSLSVTGGSQLSASTFGTGNSGNVIIRARESVAFEGSNTTEDGNLLVSAAFSTVEEDAIGTGGDVTIDAQFLRIANGAALTASTLGTGNAGNIIIRTRDNVTLEGTSEDRQSIGGVYSGVDANAEGDGGDVTIDTGSLNVFNGASLNSSTLGRGNAGNIIIRARDSVTFESTNQDRQFVSGVYSAVNTNAEGNGGDVSIDTGSLNVFNGASLNSFTLGRGNAGNIIIRARDGVTFEGTNQDRQFVSAANSAVGESARGEGGDIQINANSLRISDGGLSAVSNGNGNAGNILLAIRDRLQLQNGTIETNAGTASGGETTISAATIILRGDSDIQTFVNSGNNNGGNITISADALVALDDSDILAFSTDGQGGNIDLRQTTLFSNPLNPVSNNLTREQLTTSSNQTTSDGTGLAALDGNGRVDINASGSIASGEISINSTNLVENGLTELPNNLVNPDALVANSCIARSNNNGTLILTGRDQLPQSPNDALSNHYIAGTVSTIPADNTNLASITEPQAIYQLADGRLIMSQDCES